MSISRFLVVPALVAGVLVAQAGLAAPASAAGPRYASPTGTSAQNCLTLATACSLAKAVNQAVTGDEVFVSPGTYSLGATGLTNNQVNVNVHGYVGQPRPVLITSANVGLELKGDGAKVADLTIVHTGSLFGLNVFATGIQVQRVEVHSSGAVSCGIGYAGVARDLTCANGAAGGIALDDSWGGGTGLLTVRNLTAVATGASSFGIRADSTGNTTNLDISARNVIASGTKADIRSAEVGTDSESDVSLTNSNYDTIEEGGGGNVTNVGSSPSNQTALPIFSDGSFHQALGSPTIDKGATDGSVGTTDVDGGARKVGVAVDIGADEYVPDITPPDTAFDKTPKHRTRKHKAKFKFHASEAVVFVCGVDKKPLIACNSPLKLKFKKTGKHTLTVVAIDASGNLDPTPATYTWKIKKKKQKGRGHH